MDISRIYGKREGSVEEILAQVVSLLGDCEVGELEWSVVLSLPDLSQVNNLIKKVGFTFGCCPKLLLFIEIGLCSGLNFSSFSFTPLVDCDIGFIPIVLLRFDFAYLPLNLFKQ